jgi:hypothetical protein
VIGGVVTEVRRVITKARATMGVATLEDLQGTMEVIVFPKVFEQTVATWSEDAILLVAGRVDHKGEETVLLADAVWTWEQASAMGAPAFAREVARGDRGRRFAGTPRNANANGHGSASGNGQGTGHLPAALGANGTTDVVSVPPSAAVREVEVTARAVGPGPAPSGPRLVRTIPLVSPLRGSSIEGTLDVYTGGGSAPAVATLSAPNDTEEPPLPEEAVQDLLARERAPTVPIEAVGGKSLHIRLSSGAQDELIEAMRTLRQLFHERPGDTPVVLHVPVAPGRSQRMDLRLRVAYDAELVSLIGRRIGERMVTLSLAD